MSATRIFIVEDEAVTAADLHDELIAQGYEVAGTADTAEAAVRGVEQTKPDLVLMDINLAGDVDGVLVASAMRGEGVPVIFLTAHYDRATIERAKHATPVGYLTKPFESHQLSITIEIGLERHRAEAERTRLVRELEAERAQVKMLRGLLPICCCCKKIRDDGGYWQNVEAYISARSEADFTHGYCPACEEKAIAELKEIAGMFDRPGTGQ